MRYLGILVTFLIGVILRGLILKVLWEWFVSAYFGLKELTIPEALGLSLVVGYLFDRGSSAEEKRSPEESLAYLIVVPLIVLALGWLIHLFM